MPRPSFSPSLRTEPSPEEPSTPYAPPVVTPEPPVVDPGTPVAEARVIPERAEPGDGRYVRFARSAQRIEEWHQLRSEQVEIEPGRTVEMLVFLRKWRGRDPSAFLDENGEPQTPPIVELSQTVRRLRSQWRRKAAILARAASQVSEGDSP